MTADRAIDPFPLSPGEPETAAYSLDKVSAFRILRVDSKHL